MPVNDASRSAPPHASTIELILGVLALAAAGASGALLFAIAEAGYSTFGQLATAVVLPAIALLAAMMVVSWRMRWRWLLRALLSGVLAGAVATIGLEIIRGVGFNVFHSMPGSLPKLMGVLVTGRIMQGPDLVSNLAGWGDHFWNGAMFGLVYVLLVGRARPMWVGAVYGAILGTGFLLSPVPVAIGVGTFGAQFGASFAITVYLAHMVFGVSIAWLTFRFGLGASLWEEALVHRRPDLPQQDLGPPSPGLGRRVRL